MIMEAIFGPAGQCDAARAQKIKTTLQYLDFIKEQGLGAFEYQCGHGVNIREDTARLVGEKAKKLQIALSVHAPYFISLASLEEEKRLKSVNAYILSSARVVDWLGGDRIVVHPGGLNKRSREEALAVANETLRRAQEVLDENGLSHIHICPETMGKVSQLGDLDEVIAMCREQERFLPCIDFGHMNARTRGSMREKAQYSALLERLQNELGWERVCGMHVHFSKIEYSAAGEVRHLTFADTRYGPDYEPLMELFAQRGMNPTVICESAGTQCADARTMQAYYRAEQARRKESGGVKT